MSLKNHLTVLAVYCFTAILLTDASAQVVNFTETFTGGDANWRGPAPDGSDALVVVGGGGPDGSSYVSTDFNFEFFPDGSGMNGGQPTVSVFRGQDEFGSSDGAFEGNWI